MLKRALLYPITAILLTGWLAAGPALAEWSDDPSARTPVCTADYDQTDLGLVAVDDGFVLTWQGPRRENTHVDLYAQKFSIDGEMLWTENGRVVAAGPDGALVCPIQINAGLLPDGKGGALAAWNDTNAVGYAQAFATRIDAGGTVEWGDPGEAIQLPDTAVPLMFNATTGLNGLPPTMGIAADTEGGFFAPVWTGIGRFDAQGRQRTNWFEDDSYGFYFSGHTNPMIPVIEDDGSDGLIVIWPQGNLYFVKDIRARKLVDPESQWPDQPDTLSDAWGAVTLLDPFPLTTIQVCRIAAVPDGAGGAITAWMDDRARSETEVFPRIYAQRINAEGNVMWASEGIEVSGDLDCHISIKLEVTDDGEGGIVLAWNDPQENLWAQRLDANGVKLWDANGVLVASSPSIYDDLSTQGLVRTTDGNFVVLYYDEPHALLVAQKLAAEDGNALWEDGQLVYEGCFSAYYDWVVEVSDGRAGIVAAWPGCDGDLYAHRVAETEFEDDLVAELLGVNQGDEDTTAVLEIGAPGSGLLSLSVATDNGEAIIPSFTPGTTDPVELQLLADNDAVTTFHVEAETPGGVHDVHLGVIRNLGRTDVVELLNGEILAVESSTFTGITPAQVRAEILNLEPGLKRMNIDINGALFESLKRLEDNQLIERDLSDVLDQPSNTLTVTSYGRAGLAAVVLIAPARRL